MRGRGEQVLRKLAWAFAAAAVVVIGCGGGGGGSSSNGSTNGTTNGTTTGSFVKLPSNAPGQVAVSFLTGALRSPNDMTAVISRVVLRDAFGEVEKPINPDLRLLLNGYTHQISYVSAITTNSRFFTNFLLQVDRVEFDNGSGTDVYPPSGTQPLVEVEYPASIRALPGRMTSVVVRLDDTMFDLAAATLEPPEPIFQDDLWRLANLEENPVQGIDTLNGTLADYVMFDLSGMSSLDRPQLSGGGAAGKVYFSGDFAAVSSGGNSGTFEVLTPLGFRSGNFTGIVNLPNPTGNSLPFGTYFLTQPDPREPDPETANQITALQGIYYQLADVVGGLSSFEMISFPRSREREVLDNQSGQNVLRELSAQDVILIQRSGNTITQMYFGEIDFGTNLGDPATIRAYPIGQIDDGDAMNEIEGTVSGFKDVNGNAISISVGDPNVRATNIQKIGSGTFTLQSGTDVIYGGPLPSGFPSTGRFLVFRK